jgi:hypothetical protein
MAEKLSISLMSRRAEKQLQFELIAPDIFVDRVNRLLFSGFPIWTSVIG